MIGLAPQIDRALHRVQSHAAGADDHHAAQGRHLGPVDHGAEAGRHPAGEQRGHIDGDVVGDLHQLRLLHQHVLGETAHPGLLDDVLTLLVGERALTS